MAKLQKHGGKPRYFELLIDTGADYTLISKYDAKLLGIDYEKLPEKEMRVEVANLNILLTKKVYLILNLQEKKLNIPVLIAKGHVESLLGRKGIFEHFDILFQESQQQVIFIRI